MTEASTTVVLMERKVRPTARGTQSRSSEGRIERNSESSGRCNVVLVVEGAVVLDNKKAGTTTFDIGKEGATGSTAVRSKESAISSTARGSCDPLASVAGTTESLKERKA